MMEPTLDTSHATNGDNVEGTPDALSGGPSNNGLRRRIVRIVLAVLIVVALVLGIPYYLHAISHESTDDAIIEGHVIPISPRVAGHVATVRVRDNQWVKAGDPLVELDPHDFQARLDAAKAALEAARAVGRSRAIGVDLTTITSGAGVDEALAGVDAATATVTTAQAQAAAAVSQRDQARAQLAAAKAALNQAKAVVAASQAKHERDVADLKRIREMATSDTVNAQQVDHAVANERVSASDLEADKLKVQTMEAMRRQAEAGLAAAEDNMRLTQAQVLTRQAELARAQANLAAARSAPKQVDQSRSQADVAKAGIDQAQADLEQAELNLSYTKILAPADGHVTRKSVEPGAYVQVGQSLMAIVPPDVWVTANFKETQLTRMRPGQPARIKVDAYPGVALQGRVESIQRGTGARFSLLPPENATGNFVKVIQRVPVKILFDDRQQTQRYLLGPGMSVVPEVNVTAEGKPDPSRQAVQTDSRAAMAEADATPAR
jgi:membrane fusion protein (multidrug efflux system)